MIIDNDTNAAEYWTRRLNDYRRSLGLYPLEGTGTIIDNDTGSRCQADCWGEIPDYLEQTDNGEILCVDCGAVMYDADAELVEPDTSDPDPAFHNSNFYDITTGSR